MDRQHKSRCINDQIVQNVLLIWLDSNIDQNTADCQNTITKLQRVINLIQTFTESDRCIEFLKKINDDKAYLIISGSFGEHLMPQIHDLTHVDTIFIFCGNKSHHEIWAKNWSKIKGVFAKIEPICEALKKLTRQHEQDSIPMSFIKTNASSFVYASIFKEILLTIQFEERHIQYFLKYCRNLFADNDYELENINKFEQTRTKKSPVRWYTSDCFLYPMLNRALRSLDGDIIIKMGFFIADLHRQIEELHKEQFGDGQAHTPFIVYREQGMTKIEFTKFQQNTGGLLSFNNFLLASKKREVSLSFAHNVLFVMKIQPDQSTIPFASIQQHNCDGSMDEKILFAMNSVFRIDGIQPTSDNPDTYIVNLTLTNNNDKDLQMLTDRIRQETCPNSSGWHRLGSVLCKMGQLENAEQIYKMLLKQQETDNIAKASIYDQLGTIKTQQESYNEAFQFYEESLKVRQQSLAPNHPDLATSYNNIADIYNRLSDYVQALSNYEKALAIRQQSFAPNHPDLAMTYNHIGEIYKHMQDYSKAYSFFEKAIDIAQKTLPENHPHLTIYKNNLDKIKHKV